MGGTRVGFICPRCGVRLPSTSRPGYITSCILSSKNYCFRHLSVHKIERTVSSCKLLEARSLYRGNTLLESVFRPRGCVKVCILLFWRPTNGGQRREDIVTSVPNSDWLEVVPNVGIHFGIKMSVLSCLLVVVSKGTCDHWHSVVEAWGVLRRSTCR